LLYPVVLLMCIYCHIACAQDYSQYHLNIIKAEEQVFVNGKTEDGLKTYLNTFNQYDFVFLHDCFIAIQIALYANDENAFLAFVEKGAQNGLLPKHLTFRGTRFIKTHPIYIKNKDTILAICRANRQHYLQRLDT